MLSFTAPFYGNIKSLTVDPQDNSLWVITENPLGSSIAPTQINVQQLIEKKRPNDCVHPQNYDKGYISSAYGHETGLYFVSQEGQVYKKGKLCSKSKKTDPDQFEFIVCMDLGTEFGLQGITGFVDGRSAFPKSEPVQGESHITCQRRGKSSNKILLVGTSQAIVVEVGTDGSFTKVKTFENKNGKNSKISSWAAETVFLETENTTYHCALGYENGCLDLYFTSDDSNNFSSAKLYDADEVEFESGVALHKRGVNALLYVRDIDRYGKENRYLVSTGGDSKTYQISLKESIFIPRMPDRYHTRPIRTLVAGGFATGSSGREFSRFYSLSDDQTAKVWTNEYSTVALSTYQAEMHVATGCVIILPFQHTSGAYSKGEFQGKLIPTPYLVVAGKNCIKIVPIVKYDRGDTKELKTLDKNGRLESTPIVKISGDMSYVREYGTCSDAKVRQLSMERFKTWNSIEIIDTLQEIVLNTDFDFAYQKSALLALKESKQERRIICLEDLLNEYNTEPIQKLAYECLKEIFRDSPRPYQLALHNGSHNIILTVIKDLAHISRGNGPFKREALEMLQGLINNQNYDIALRAYDFICGEMEGEEAVIPGVEGVLYGIYSDRTDIRREMAVRLANRDLVHAFETTLILRRLLESRNETIRERALDVSLLRAPAAASVLRKNPDNIDLHQRLYVLSEGALSSDVEERNKVLQAALPTDEDIEAYEIAFRNEDPSIEDDVDVLVELTSCSQDDVSIYALLTKAMLGFEGAVQGLLQLSNHNNEKILRLATIGLGCFYHLDDAFQRICGLTLSKGTPPRIGCISIFYAVKGYDYRKEDPIKNVLRKVLDSGNSELRKTAMTIGQDRINKRLKKIKKLKEVNTGKEQKKQEGDITDLRTQLKKAQAGLDFAVKTNNEVVKDLMLDEIAEIESQLDGFSGVTRTLSGELAELFEERDLLKIGLLEETIDMRIRKEAYKSFLKHNLEDGQLSTDKTPTLKMLLNLRDHVLFQNALKDLLAYLDNVDFRPWALKLFKALINQDIKPKHHSNVWSIWTAGADWSERKDYEEQILRIGFECSIPCNCRTYTNGRFEVCLRHRIRRDAFLRVLRGSGDWLADFIREALSGKSNSSAGVSVAAVAVSDQGKRAVDRLDDPESFIFSLFKDQKSKKNINKNIGYACDLLKMYPKHYSERIQDVFFALRNNSNVLKAVNQEYRLLTEKFYNFYIDKVKEGRDEMFTKNIERYASEHDLLEALMPTLLESDNSRLISKALQIASQNYDAWGKDILMSALEDNDERKSKRGFGLLKARLERDALRKKNDDALRDFVMDYFNNAPVYKQSWVLETIRITKNTPSWVEELIKTSSDSNSIELRLKAFELIQATQAKDPWMLKILKKGLTDPNSHISSAAFQSLLAVNKLLGPAEERKFVTESMRKTEENRERAIAAGLQTTASWRVAFILEALNDEDHMIRSYMCEKIRGTSGLSDEFYQGLLTHKDLEVRQLAQDVLAARGLYRPSRKSSSDNLEKTILEAPQPMPKGRGSWFAWIAWYWNVQDWKTRKIKAIIAAGKTHDPHYYSVFRKLLTKFGFHSKISNLWYDAMRYTSWWYQDWWEFIILEMGWVLSDKDIKEAKKEAKEQRDNRIRVAWNIACNRYGDKETLKWTINQYYDNGWRNQYKNHIKREYLFEGLFSVDSFVGFESKTEGAAFSMMQRLMDDDTSFANDLFRLNMLRLSEQGGPVDYIGIGYTCDDDQTVVESVLMRENQHSKEGLLNALLELLNNRDIPERDPYALSNVGGVWYDVVRLTLELNMNTYDLTSTVAPEFWKRIARMISCQHPQLRARAVRSYFHRHVYGEEKERFQADVENFARQLSSTVVDNYALLQDGKETDEKQSVDLAFDGYIGLLRKRAFTLQYRRDAIRYVVGMCSDVEDAQRVVPILKSALTLEKPQLRFEAYRQLIEIQAKDNTLVKLDQLIQMGLRSTDKRLKKMAISLIWCTDQLDKASKISRLEFILKNMNDAAAEYAFELLYAIAGRPTAWDTADETKDQDEANAKSTFDKAIEDYNADIKKRRDDFNSFQEGFNAAPNAEGRDQSALVNRRSEMLKSIEELETKKREANSQYEQDLSLAVENHKSSMDAPLTEADQQTWADAIARRDEVIGMAIDAYYPDLRISAVDKGLTECARRRIYFEKDLEEFEGYFERLLAIVEQGLQSSYSSVVQHTAVSMAEKYFKGAYKVLLGYLNSHDQEIQYLGIEGLTCYGPLGLTEFQDENGNDYPRTSIVFLDRLANDKYGTIDRYSIFEAIGRLKDSHSTVVEALFEFLERGMEDPDYGTVLDTLITISGCSDSILSGMKWSDLTHSDYSSLQPYLSHELDWERVDEDKFVTYYQDVFNETLLARIIENLYVRGDYANIYNYALINHCMDTKGFDIWKHAENGIATKQPIDEILGEIALLDKNSDAKNIRSQAIKTLIYRLKNRETWYIPALESTKDSSTLIMSMTSVIDQTKDDVTHELLRLTTVMAYAGLQGKTTAIFNTLYSVATVQSYKVDWRTKAMKALGQLSDERAVVALLKAAGFDAYGEELLVEPNIPALSTYDKEKLMVAASEGLGGMIFAQESESIFQLLSKMTRSKTRNVRQHGFAGLRYFGRSEEHALKVTGIFAGRLQSVVNSNSYNTIRFFLQLITKVLEPLSTENVEENAEIVIRPHTEELVKEYILQTLFGEVFELDGEAHNPLNIEKNLFEIENTEFLELAFQNVRQLVHGPYQEENQQEENQQEIKEVPIDYSYLAGKTSAERTVALKAEVLLFQNKATTKYSVDVAKEIANYLSNREIFNLLEEAYQNDFESNSDSTIARYSTLFQNIILRKPSPIELAFKLMRKDYTLNLHEDLSSSYYNMTVLPLFRANLDGLATHMNLFEENVVWYYKQFNTFVERNRFGDRRKFDVCLSFFEILRDLFSIYESLPNSTVVAETIKNVMKQVYLVKGLEHPQQVYIALFESYLKSGGIDWDFVNDILDEQHRSLRDVLVNQLTIEHVNDMTPVIFNWLLSDQSSLLRLVDVLASQKSEIQNQIVTSLKDSGQPTGVLLVLAKLNDVDVFKALIDSFRDEAGKITDEDGLRSRTAPRSTENTYTPITVDILCQGLSMIATEEAEYYLRDLSEDSNLEYGLRRAVLRSANVAHRRRVPLHIRRTQRQQS
jgi:hypothetical protein